MKLYKKLHTRLHKNKLHICGCWNWPVSPPDLTLPDLVFYYVYANYYSPYFVSTFYKISLICFTHLNLAHKLKIVDMICFLMESHVLLAKLCFFLKVLTGFIS